jgi:hypothetical protein
MNRPETAVNAKAARIVLGLFQGKQVVRQVGQVLLGLADKFVDQGPVAWHDQFSKGVVSTDYFLLSTVY